MFLLTPFFGGQIGWSQEATGPTVLENRCSGCHPPSEEGGKLAAIESERKTPEGWEMTIQRMMRTHEVRLSADEARVLVKYLSDHYGLAPEEVEPFRYALEKQPNIFEEFPSEAVQATCGQCHSYARTALQRRTQETWATLPDLKAGFLPNLENQTASGFPSLPGLWYTVVKKESMPYFAKTYPFDSAAWREWRRANWPKLEGAWKTLGHDPGKGGDYTGQVVIRRVGKDRYEGTFTHEFSDGAKVSGKTTAIVYTGFQWRGVAKLEDGKTHKEVFFVTADGSTMTGRRLLTDIGDLGMAEALHRGGGKARLLAVLPKAVKATGQPQEVRLFGLNFPQNLTAENLALGGGVTVEAVTRSGDDTIVARVVVDKRAEVGTREVEVSGVEGEGALFIYRKADYLKILPEKAYARPGGVRTPKTYQQFEALLFANGPDGKKGTKDDVNLGRVSPVKWSLEEYVDRVNDDDVRYVGAVDETGRFVPAQDGPNPQREFSRGNVGSVWVEASYMPQAARRPLRARAYLVVMPPKFNFQPID
jgi:quinohemoprotein amine dehydrogenase